MASIFRCERIKKDLLDLGYQLAAESVAEASPTGYGVNLWGMARLTSGEKAGSTVDEVKANQRITWDLGTIKPRIYHAHLVVNPALLKMGPVGAPSLCGPGEETHLSVTLFAATNHSIKDLTWIARLYLTH